MDIPTKFEKKLNEAFEALKEENTPEANLIGAVVSGTVLILNALPVKAAELFARETHGLVMQLDPKAKEMIEGTAPEVTHPDTKTVVL